MHVVIITPVAKQELLDVQHWYEKKRSGLGIRFRKEADAGIARIRSNARQFPVVYKQYRRALVQDFPYALIFFIRRDESVSIFACLHGSRNPHIWQERI